MKRKIVEKKTKNYLVREREREKGGRRSPPGGLIGRYSGLPARGRIAGRSDPAPGSPPEGTAEGFRGESRPIERDLRKKRKRLEEVLILIGLSCRKEGTTIPRRRTTSAKMSAAR